MNVKGLTNLRNQSVRTFVAFIAILVMIAIPTQAAFASSANGISAGTQTGTLTYGTAGSATYTVTVTCTGNGGGFTTNLSVSGLTAGASGLFSPTSLTWTNNCGGGASKTSTLTISTLTTAQAGTTSFTVTESHNSHTGTGSLTIGKKALTVSGITASNKVFDNGTAASLNTASAALVGNLDGANVVLGTGSATGAFSDKNVANGKTVQISGLTISGSASGNYTFTQPTTTANITAKPINVTADAQSKIYGAVDPALTYSHDALLGSDTLSGLLVRESGEAVSDYAILQGSLTAGSNYAINYTGANFSITAKTINVAAVAKSKIYGAADPALTYTNDALVSGDAFTGALARDPGEAVGSYAITQGTLALSSNYVLVFTGANLVIDPADLNVTANPQSITYGDAEPVFTFAYDGFVLGDNASNLTTEPSCGVAGTHTDAGLYSIACSGGVADNYTFVYHNGVLTIGAKAINVKADAKSKIYGAADPALTYTNDALVSGDAFTGALVRDSGEAVGSYAITQGTLGLSSNYDLVFTGADLSISAKTIHVAAVAQSKTFGDVDPALTYTSDALVSGDAFSGELVRAAGVDVGDYAITQGTLGLSSNYVLAFTGANLTISAKVINVTADPQAKTFGETDPALTFGNDPLVGADSLSGSLSRDPGENVGAYAILKGTLDAGSNYTIHYSGANLVISAKTINVVAEAKSKTYGGADPAFTYTSDPLLGSDSFNGALGRDAGEAVGAHAITLGTLSAGSNYSIHFTSADLTISVKTVNVTADAASKPFGHADPALTFTNDPLAFSDAFTGALARDPGEAAGTYAITQGTLALNSNYDLVFHGALFTINAANNPPLITEGASTSAGMNVNGKPKAFGLTLHATDADLGDILTWSLTAPAAAHGTASVPVLNTGNSKVIGYSPTHNFFGTDSFGVQVTDGTDTATITVTVNITRPILTYRSIGVQDGFVLESGENTNAGGSLNSVQIALGDDKLNKQFRGILSFNTGSLPDNAVVTQITMKVRKASLFGGGNPFVTLGNILVDVRKGNFGLAALQMSDFQAPATKDSAFTIKNNPLAGGWYYGNLGILSNTLVNKTGNTQFRLRFTKDDNNNQIANYFTFFSGPNALATNQPVLLIQYYIP